MKPCGCAEGLLGGFARRDSLLQQLAARGGNLLPVANGNLVADAGRQSELKAEIGFTALKEMGYVAFNVGGKDLFLGIDRLKYFSSTSGIPFLSANLFQGAQQVFRPFVVRTVNLGDRQVRVAIVGVLSQRFEIYAQNASTDLRLESPPVVLKLLIDRLTQESDFIVVLVHASLVESEALASAFPQIDVIISGDEQDELLEVPITKGKTVLLNTSTKGKSLGKLGIQWGRDGKMTDYDFQRLPLSERIPEYLVIFFQRDNLRLCICFRNTDVHTIFQFKP